MEPDKEDFLASAMLGYLEEIEHTHESRGTGELRGDVGEPDLLDGVHYDFPGFVHAITSAHLDVRARPDANAAGDVAVANSLSKTLRKNHSGAWRLSQLCRPMLSPQAGGDRQQPSRLTHLSGVPHSFWNHEQASRTENDLS